MTSTGSAAGRLLVAVPTLGDPNFFRSVVYVFQHTDDGALGVVLNQPSSTRVEEVFETWSTHAAAPAVAFVGGPVHRRDAAIGVARVAHVARVDASDAWQPLLGRVGTVNLELGPDDTRPDVEVVRIFAGYSGWSPGQLDDELDAGGWYVVEALPDDLLTSDPDGLWRAVLRRQGGDLAAAANYPLGGGPAVN